MEKFTFLFLPWMNKRWNFAFWVTFPIIIFISQSPVEKCKWSSPLCWNVCFVTSCAVVAKLVAWSVTQCFFYLVNLILSKVIHLGFDPKPTIAFKMSETNSLKEKRRYHNHIVKPFEWKSYGSLIWELSRNLKPKWKLKPSEFHFSSNVVFVHNIQTFMFIIEH